MVGYLNENKKENDVRRWRQVLEEEKKAGSFFLSLPSMLKCVAFLRHASLLALCRCRFFLLLLLLLSSSSSSRTRTTRTRNCLENASKFLYFSISPIISVFSTPKRKTETEKKRKEKPNGLIIEKMKTTVVRPIWARKF